MENFKPTRKFWEAYKALYSDHQIELPVTVTTAKKTAIKPAKEAVGQIKLVNWAWGAGLFLMSIPNSGKRTAWQGAKEKAMGLMVGASDLFLAMPNHVSHGYFIEMKRKGRKPTESQIEFISRARSLGYCADWFDDWERARQAIIAYLGD